MHRLLIIPALLFGLLFAAGGYFMLAETALPMWRNWQEMRDWRPANAQLLSISAADNETRARYRYEFAGQGYQGTRVGVSPFKDNIGPYHRDMQAYLQRIRVNRESLPIWVNPRDPTQAVIDREMRWGLFALSVGFCSIFLLIGLVVIYSSLMSAGKAGKRRSPGLAQLRRNWRQAKKAGATELGFLEFTRQQYVEYGVSENGADDIVPETYWKQRSGWESPRIRSQAGKAAWQWWFFAVVWNAVSTPLLFVLPEELRAGNYPALLGLLFPVAGLFLLYKAIVTSLELHRFGRVICIMDPYPGAIGGHVGGHIQVKNLDYRRAREAQDLLIKLECVHSYVSGSGKNRSRRESIKWAEQGEPKIENGIEGVNLAFRFDVPANLPQADVEQKGAYHFWRLGVSAEIPGIDLVRSYNIPVFATGATSQNVSHDISARSLSRRKQEADAARLAIASGRFDIEGLSRAMRFNNEGNRIQLRFPMFRNRFLTLFAAVFAGGFGFASYSMVEMGSGGGLFAVFTIIIGIPFFLVALAAAIATVYLPFNNLKVDIESGRVSVLRRLLFIPVFSRSLRREDIDYLDIRRSGSTGQGVDRVEHFKIRAHDKQGRKVTLAEDIDGEDVAKHLRDYLAQRIGVAAR